MYQKNFILIVFLITLLGNAKMRQEKTELNNNYTAVAISVIIYLHILKIKKSH